MHLRWILLALMGGVAIGCASVPPGESRFPAAEPQMPMITYYDMAPTSPLGPPVREGAIANDPMEGGGESPV